MSNDRRKGLRRQHDKELDEMLQELRSDFQAHVRECTESGRVLRAEVKEVRDTQKEQHEENRRALRTISNEQTETLRLNQDQLEILNVIASGKRFTVGAGKFVIWIGSIVAALLATAAGWSWLKSH